MRRHVFNSVRQLQFGNIMLVPVDNGVYPYTERPNEWHVHGCRTMTTTELLKLANDRGITITLTETSVDGHTTSRLN